MIIELKNIKVAEHLSKETTAFTADLYINYVKAGFCKNDGGGGATVYHAYKTEYKVLISAAEMYCDKLPPIPVPMGDSIHNITNCLEVTIDDLVHKFLCDKDKQKFERRKQRDMQKGILIGNDEGYVVYNFSKPLSEIIKFHTNPVQFLNDKLQELLKKVKPGQQFLNTNFPEGVHVPEVAEV